MVNGLLKSRRVATRAVLALWLALVAWPGGHVVAAKELKQGDLAPDFSLPGSDGKTHQLSAYRDRQVVVIAWFPKAFTGG
jgi:peroxiredoxin Q/BCP